MALESIPPLNKHEIGTSLINCLLTDFVSICFSSVFVSE